MLHDVVFITKNTTYKELREILVATPYLRSYPLVTDNGNLNFLNIKKN